MRAFLTSLFACFLSLLAYSQASVPTDEEVKIRTETISKTLRCVVCQNQSIYESNAPLAADMRRLVEERVRAGDTDDEVRNYLRGPYGDVVLMTPPVKANTLILWFGPLILLVFFAAWFLKQKSTQTFSTNENELSKDNKERLNAVSQSDESGPK